MSINLSSLTAALGAKAGELQADIKSLGADGKNMSETELLDLQMQVSQYQQIAGLTSAIISDIKQAAQGIIQKV